MVLLRYRTWFLLCLAPVAALTAQAPKPAPSPVKFTGDLGFVSTTGNTSVQTLNVGDKVVAKFRTVSFTQQFAVVHGKSKGETVASNWRASLRTDVALQPTFGVFGSLNYERNVFAGLASRVSNVVGLSAELYKGQRDRVTLEGGISITAQRAVSDTKGRNLDFLGGRAATSYVHSFGAKASVSQQVELLPNFRESADLRMNTETAITAPITRQIGIRLSYVVRYDGQPVPGYGTSDQLFTSGIQINL
jgi:putative salt-induced outer membrane protein